MKTFEEKLAELFSLEDFASEVEYLGEGAYVALTEFPPMMEQMQAAMDYGLDREPGEGWVESGWATVIHDSQGFTGWTMYDSFEDAKLEFEVMVETYYHTETE